MARAPAPAWERVRRTSGRQLPTATRAGLTAAPSLCPDCGRFSDRVHDRCLRRLKDLPLAEQGAVIRLTVRRAALRDIHP
ncbi:transposase family protein [Streptomyces sp. NPDC127172]|uniref:transposase family protein n=1 Tax=Streptomyces sp. NPDC127172 TaxID=3345382 RepID=UPI003641393C